jgi:PGF-pre-PGF domain-containing protein
MGISSSKESASNVASKELVTRYVTNGEHIRYDFPNNNTCIVYIEYDAERTFQKTTTTVEMLKEKSKFVPILPNGRIYKNVNIWVGDKGGGLPRSLKNGLIKFRVEKSWINDSNVMNP